MKKADNFDATKWLVENKITFQSRLNENKIPGVDVEVDDDMITLSGDSGDYDGFIEDDGTVSFSVVYEDEDDRDGMEFDEDNWKSILGDDHVFVKITNAINTKVEALGDSVMITVKADDLTSMNESKLNEESGTPSDGMHNVMLSYIRPDARDTYPKDYNKYFIFLRAQAKPMSGPSKPQIWMRFLKDLVKNKAVAMNDLIDFSEKGYNSGGPDLEGLATYLFKQGTPDIIQKIDNLSKSKLNENEDLTSQIAALPDFETSPDTEEATLVVGKYAVVHYDESDEGGEDMYVVWDNTVNQDEIGSYDDEPEFESTDPAEVAAFLKKNS